MSDPLFTTQELQRLNAAALTVKLYDTRFFFARSDAKIKNDIVQELTFVGSLQTPPMTWKQVAFHAYNNLLQLPLCECGKVRQWTNQYKKYNQYCSKKCVFSIEMMVKKQKQTCIEQDTYTKIQEKIKQTLAKKDVTNVFQLPEVKDKIKNTCLRKYGVPYVLSKGSSVKIAIEQKNIELYGRKNQVSFDSAQFKATMLKRYGVESALQHPEIKAHCIKTRVDRRFKERIAEVKDKGFLPQDAECTKWVHLRCGSTFLSVLNAQFHCPVCHGNRSKGEATLREMVLQRCSKPILFSKRRTIKPYELDIFIPELKLAFEFNGAWHHRLGGKCLPLSEKSRLCDEKDIELLHIWDFELKQSWVADLLDCALGLKQQQDTPDALCIDNRFMNIFKQQNISSSYIIERTEPATEVLIKTNSGLLLLEDYGRTFLRKI